MSNHNHKNLFVSTYVYCKESANEPDYKSLIMVKQLVYTFICCVGGFSSLQKLLLFTIAIAEFFF